MPDRIDKQTSHDILAENTPTIAESMYEELGSTNPNTKSDLPLTKTDSSKPAIVKNNSPLPTDLKAGGSSHVQNSVADHISPNASATDSKFPMSQHFEPSPLPNLKSEVKLPRPENSTLAEHIIRA